MKTSILTGLSAQDKDLCKAQFEGSKRLRQQLVRVLERQKEGLTKEILSEEFVKEPGWEYSFASKSAEIRSLEKIIKLL